MESVTIIGFGWLGKACADLLHDHNYLVKVTNRNADLPNFKYPNFAWKLGESFPTKAISNLVIISIAEKENNFSNYIKLYRDLEKEGVKKIIFISSTTIYNGLNGLITENSELIISDSNFNVAQKEFTLKETSISSVILRLSGLVGPNRNPALFLTGRTNVPNPNNKINLVHQFDVIRFIEKCIEEEATGVYNVCSSSHPSREEFYTSICKSQNLEVPLFADDSEEIRWVDNSKSKTLSNFSYKYDDLLKYYASSEARD